MRYYIKTLIIFFLMGHVLLAQEQSHRMWQERPLDQNVIKNWSFSNPLGRATIWDIDQDEEGFLWLATSEGVIRFDGIRSTVFDLSNSPVFESQDFAQVEVAKDGRVWVSGRSGLYYYDGDQFNEWKNDGVTLNSVWKIITRGNDELLVLANGKPFLVEGNKFIENPYGIERAYQFKRGFDDRVWVILENGKVQYVKNQKLYDHEAINEYAGEVAVRMVVDDAYGNLYISLDNEKLLYYNHEEFIEINADQAFNIGIVRNLFPDSHGFVWGSSINGAFRFHKDKIERLTIHDGLTDNGVRTLYEDRSGDIWIGTFRGLNYIYKSPIGLIQLKEDGKSVPVETKSVIEDSEKRIWVGTNDRGLYLYHEKHLLKPKASFKVPKNIFTIFECNNGDLLLGGTEGLIKTRYSNGVLQFVERITSQDVRFAFSTTSGAIWFNAVGQLSGSTTLVYTDGNLSQVEELDGKRIRWMYEFENGDLVIGTRAGLFRIINGQLVEIGKDLGFSTEAFTNLWPGEDNLWTITEGKSLIRFKENSDTVTIHNARNGFNINSPTAIMMDANDGVWLSSLSGLYRISLQELERNIAMQDSLKNVEYYPANVTVNPAGYPINWKAEDGIIYYTSPQGLVVANEKYRASRRKNYKIESINVDGVELKPEGIVELSPKANKVAVRFSTIDFQNRGDLSFEFQLEGFDEGWSSTSGVRDIYYTNLPPGDYTFRLREVNSDGYYEDSSQSFQIKKAQYWYSTTIAFIVYGLLVILSAYLIYKMRTSNIRALNERLQKQVAARTTALEEVLANLEEKVEERTASLKKLNDELNMAMDAGKHAAYKWYLNRHGHRMAEYSDRYFQLLGYEPGSFKTNWVTLIEMIHPEDREYVAQTIQNILESQGSKDPIDSFELEYRVRKKDGKYIWMLSNGEVVNSVVMGLVTDISERKKAEAERRSSEEMFRKLFEASTSALLVVDSEGKVVMHNARSEELFGYRGNEWSSLKVEDLVPDNKRDYHSGLREAYHNGSCSGAVNIERDLEGLNKEGGVIPIKLGLSPINLKDKKYTLAMVIDMSERVKMENALKASKRELQREKDRYVSIFQNINDSLFIMDVEEDGRFKLKEFNKAQEATTGIKSSQIRNKYTYEAFPEISDYLDWRYSTCRDSKQVITYLEQLEFKTGLKDFKTSLVPIIENDKVVRIIGIAHDITDQVAQETLIKDKEEKLRYALQASQDAIFDWNMTKGMLEFSDAFYRMFDYKRGEIEEDLESLMSITNQDDIEHIKKNDLVKIINSLDDGQQFTNSFRMKKKSGDWLWVLLKGKVVERDEEGKAQRFVGTITDITGEREKTKERLETILLTEDNERSRISREIHDGLQQTLTITALNMEFAKKEEEKLSEKARVKLQTAWEYLQKSIAESRTVAHSLMPKAIVDFGLVSACKSLVMQYNNSNDGTIFRFHENLNGQRISDKNVEVTLYRILQEATNNIVKYAKASQVNVQLKMYEDIIQMTIEDNGVGFNVETVREKGMGYGLKSMQNRIDAISGHLEIDSAPGKGTVVIVEIFKEVLA